MSKKSAMLEVPIYIVKSQTSLIFRQFSNLQVAHFKQRILDSAVVTSKFWLNKSNLFAVLKIDQKISVNQAESLTVFFQVHYFLLHYCVEIEILFFSYRFLMENSVASSNM